MIFQFIKQLAKMNLQLIAVEYIVLQFTEGVCNTKRQALVGRDPSNEYFKNLQNLSNIKHGNHSNDFER